MRMVDIGEQVNVVFKGEADYIVISIGRFATDVVFLPDLDI